MATQYFKRYRMECDLRTPLPSPELPADFFWLKWQDSLLERHAWVKQQSFHQELDAEVFPCLGDYFGCVRLMKDITRQHAFIPGATWLIASHHWAIADVGTIQGLQASSYCGAIQNVGVAPEFRGRGLGRALVLRSLHGFREAGLTRASLEVTATNTAAIGLYSSIGFCITRTMYRAVEREAASTLGV